MEMEKIFKGFDFEELNNELDYLNDLVSSNTNEDNVLGFAYQMTAYEQGYIDYTKGLIDLLDLDMDVNKYNEYLIENNYEEFKPFEDDTINEYFSSPYEAMRAAHFGEVSFNDEYFKLDGYGNIETYSNYRIEQEMSEDEKFKEWLIEQDYSEFMEDSVKDDIIRLTRYLVNKGF